MRRLSGRPVVARIVQARAERDGAEVVAQPALHGDLPAAQPGRRVAGERGLVDDAMSTVSPETGAAA